MVCSFSFSLCQGIRWNCISESAPAEFMQVKCLLKSIEKIAEERFQDWAAWEG